MTKLPRTGRKPSNKKRSAIIARDRDQVPATTDQARTVVGKRAVLLAIASGTSITDAARAAGVTRTTVARWRTDPAFAEAWAEAETELVEKIEAEVIRRSLDPAHGSDIILLFAAKKFIPAYRENHKVEHTHTHKAGQHFDDRFAAFAAAVRESAMKAMEAERLARIASEGNPVTSSMSDITPTRTNNS